MNKIDKAQLRRQLLTWRKTLTDIEVQERSQKIIERALKLVLWQETRSLHIYVPITRNKEVDTWTMLEYVLSELPTHIVAVPVMQAVGDVISMGVTQHTTWRLNSLGMREPVDGVQVAAQAKFDVIIVPTLGFTKDGYRLGYGGGYYDKFLATQPQALTIGLCYDEGRTVFTPEKHDIPLSMTITDKAVYRVSRAA